jgi:hypothetical protein
MRYVDAFISHKQEDLHRARELKALISSGGHTCYVSGDDEELQRLTDPKATAERIREVLRTCRCLIWAYSEASAKSGWMPWELGFFDGRCGPGQIGLYDLDDPRRSSSSKDKAEPSSLSMQEYLKIYTGLTPDTLHRFVSEAASTRALSNRADVDVDRFAALMAGAMRNPIDFSIGSIQYVVSLQHELWRQSIRQASPTQSGAEALNGLKDILHVWREFAEAFEAPRALHPATDEIVGGLRGASGDALKR